MPALIGTLLLAETSIFAIGGPSALVVGGVSVSPLAIGSTALLAASIGLSYALQSTPKQPKPADGLLSIRQPNPVRQGGYGRMRVAGAYMLFDVDAGAGTSSVDILALISGRICGFGQLYLHEDAPLLSGSNVSSLPDGRYFGTSVFCDFKFGLPTEVAFAAFGTAQTPVWTTAHRGDGIASMNVLCIQAPTSDKQTFYYPNGRPEPSFELDLYPLWDPRDSTQDPDDSDTWVHYPAWNSGTNYVPGDRVVVPSRCNATAWSGGTTYARYAAVTSGGIGWYSRVNGNVGITPGTNIAKWLPLGGPYIARFPNLNTPPVGNAGAWISICSNPILQLIDYLTNNDHGMGLDRDILITPVLDSLVDKANRCDRLVFDKVGNNGPLYTSNGKFNFDDDPADVLGQIGAACDAWWCEGEDGALALEVGVYSPPSLTIKPEHIVAFSMAYGIADEQVVNELTIAFTDPVNTYKEVAGQAWRDEADISSRGRTRSQSLSLKWVHRHSQARRLAKRAMARLTAKHGTVTTTLYGLAALGQRWVTLQYPFLPQVSNCVVELSRATIEMTKGTITFDWMLIDPATIDQWTPSTEEGEGPAL